MSVPVFGQSKNIGPVLFWAQMYLKEMRNEWPNSPLAVVFDIDDTAVSVNTQQVMPEFKKVYDLARALNYAIFFITARIDMNGNAQNTMQQLKAVGFTHIDGLFLMPQEYLSEPNFSMYKYRMRKHVINSGYNIVLNAGDAWHDLMLLHPYQTDYQQLSHIDKLMTCSKRNYVIFRPPDVAWMAIKFPEVFYTKQQQKDTGQLYIL
jgi:predicted secreted acid phosphatase